MLCWGTRAAATYLADFLDLDKAYELQQSILFYGLL